MDPIAAILSGNLSEFRAWRERGGYAPRVQLHPATDAWMMGDRYGEVVRATPTYIYVLCDRSGMTRRMPWNLVLTSTDAGAATFAESRA